MARGLQKLQSQAKNQEKQSNKKSAHDNKKSAQAGLLFQCVVCKAQLPDPKTYKQHFESKHPKAEMPAELKDVVA